MKKFFVSLLLLAGMMSLAACSKPKPDYEIAFGPMADCRYGDTVMLPDVIVTSGNESAAAEYTITVTDPDGNVVAVTDDSFVASVVGEYTVSIAIDGKTKEIKFICNALQQAAVRDLSVSLSGELTFTEVQGNTYTLYRGEDELGGVKSGANIADKIVEGHNLFTVVTDAREGYLASERSNVADVEMLESVKDLTVDDDYVITFTEASGVIYEFTVNDGEEAFFFNSGDNILNYLKLGDNTISVVAKKAGAIDSAVSEKLAVRVGSYLPLDDVEVNDGIVTFTQTQGLSYKLYVNGAFRGAVNSGDSLVGFMKKNEELTTLDIQVQIEGDGDYGESKLSNTAKYYYNHGLLGNIVWDGSSRITESMTKITEISNEKDVDGTEYMRFSAQTSSAANCYASVKFDEPLVANGNSVEIYYLRIVLRLSEGNDSYRAFNRGSVGIYGEENSAMIVHMYDHNYRGKWCAAEIQISNTALSKIEGFYLEIAQADSYGKTCVDIAACEIVAYPREIETGLGVVETVRTDGTFGKNNSGYWAVPYSVGKEEGTVTVNGTAYDGYVRLYREYEVTFGGNSTFANQGTTTAGAMINYDFSEFASNNVTITLTIKSEKDIVVEGYYGKVFARTNVVSVSGEWQTVTITTEVEGLKGIGIISVNNATHYSEVPEVCIADISVEAVPAPPIAKNFSVATDGTVTFDGEEGYTYAILNSEGKIVKENAVSGDKVSINDGLNEFVIRTISELGEVSDSKKVYIYKSGFGYGVMTDNPRTVGKEVVFSEETVDDRAVLKLAGHPVSGNPVGAALILPQAIPTTSGKINYAVITYKSPVAYNAMNRMSFGVNGSAALIVHNYDASLSDSWIKAYIQLPAATTEVSSIYFEMNQANSWRETWFYLAAVEVVAFDEEIETSFGNWRVAAINDFGKVSAKWSVPYTVTESTEAVIIGEVVYNKTVRLADDAYSFGGNTTFANAGTYHTGALLKYVYEGNASSLTVTFLLKIGAGSKLAVAPYYGSAVDKTTNVIVGTGEWQKIEIQVNTADLQGFTFVAVNDAANYVSASLVEIATVNAEENLNEATAVTDLAVSRDGTVTFSATDRHTYALYRGETLVKENISSGDKTEFLEGSNEFMLKIKYLDLEASSNTVSIFKSSIGFGVMTNNPRSASNAVAYMSETIDGTETLKCSLTPAAGGVGGAVLLSSPIVTVSGKINYAVVTFKMPAAYYMITQMSIGANNSTSFIVHNYGSGLSETWVKAYIQLPAGTALLDSIYFDIPQSNSYRATCIWISRIEVVAFDSEIETSLGNWQVAAINDFGKASAKWSVPYTVVEAEETVTVNGVTYDKVVRLSDDVCSFGGNTTFANAGTYHTGALLKYTVETTEETITLKLYVRISEGSKVAIGGYYGSTVDKAANVIVGTGEWEEIEITVNAAGLQGITFVSVNNDGSNVAAPSTVDIAYVKQTV